MKNKSRKTSGKSILHDGVLVPITDPAEQAALDRRCREAEKILAGARPSLGKPKSRKGK